MTTAPAVLATGVGPLPGTDIRTAVGWVVDALPDFVHLPELPARGVAAEPAGRAVGLLAGLAADLQPAGWRLTGGSATAAGGGLDQRRARSLLAEDLDALEEIADGYQGPLKIQVAGPWTLAAVVERPRGDRVLADHGARRELAQSLAEGLAGHVADVRRRLPQAELVVQVDEPGLPGVLAAAIPTASGFGRHRAVHPPEAAALLGTVLAAVAAAGARPVVHCSAEAVPVALLVQAGATALSLDFTQLAAPVLDAVAAAVDDGLGLWPALDLVGSPAQDARDLLRLLDVVGLEPSQAGGRLVVTPAGGLAAVSEEQARNAYAGARRIARQVSEAG